MGKTAAQTRREKLRARQRQAVENRDKKGLGKKSILDWSKLSKKKPSEFVIESKKKYLIDILPFLVTQEWYKNLRTPSGLTTGLDIGEFDYKLEIPVHKYVGENNDTFICLREAFGGKCKICDDMFEEYAKDDPDEKKIKSCKPSWRDYFNVYDYDDSDADIQVWDDVSFHVWDKEFLEESEDGEEIILYTDTEEGKSIEFKTKEKKIGKNPFLIPKNISFIDRDSYDDDIVNDTVSFDSLVQIPTYEDVCKAYFSSESEDENEDNNKSEEKEEKPKSRNRRQTKKDPKPEKEENTEKSNNKCPYDKSFGRDCDPGSEDCEKCDDDIFNECADEKEKIDNKSNDENELQRDSRKKKEEVKDEVKEEKSTKRRGRKSEKDTSSDKKPENPKVTRRRRRS